MSDDSTTTVRAIFDTREAAELAVEHLVQKHGVPRPDILVQAAVEENTAGLVPSGGDVSSTGNVRKDAPLAGEIEVSADIAADQLAAIQRSMGEVGAMRVSGVKMVSSAHGPAPVDTEVSEREGKQDG